MKVRSRLFAIIFSLIVACLIIASIASLNALSTALSIEITRQLENYAVDWMYEISRDEQDKIQSLRFMSAQFSNILDSNMTDEQKDSFLIDFQRYTDSNMTVLIHERNGTKTFGIKMSPSLVHAFEQKFFNGETNSNESNEIPGTFTKSGKLWFTLTHPISDMKGTVIGGAILNYSAHSLLGNRPVGLQSDLKYDLISREGSIIYSNYALNNSALTVNYHNHPIFEKITQSERRVESGIYSNVDDSSGNRLFVAVKQQSISGLPDPGWILIPSIATEKAFSGVLNLRTTFFVITALILAIAVFVVLFISRSISKPIMALRDAAQKIRQGDLSKKIELKSTDEIGELSNQLDDMRQSIKNRTEEILEKDAELNEVNVSLLETEKSKDEFISMVSHELKTPIMPIKLYSDMLLKTDFIGMLNKKQKKAIETIRKSVERLEVLINDLLDVHKLEIGRFNLSKGIVSISKMIDQTISTLLPLAQTKKVQLISQVNTTGNIFCDPQRVEQVISNLVKNAIDFVPEDKGKVIVRVEEGTNQNMDGAINAAKGSNSYLVITVEDNGVGVPAETSGDLFKKFYQIDTSISRKHGGTGLGLAICKGIIEAHGGNIWLDLKYTQGARFRFTLPRDS